MSPAGYVHLSVADLALGLGMVLVAAVVALVQRFGILKALVWGVVRAVLQLTGMGFVLTGVFELDHPAPLLGLTAVMVLIGGHEAAKRVERPVRNMTWVATGAIAAGSTFVMGYTIAVCLEVTPWFSPRYTIPLAGIVIAFNMNAVALAADRLTAELHARRGKIEALLCLGASPKRASQGATLAALRTAWTPLLNHLMVVGVVQLPGMMTGQIIAGASPLDAVRYQILIAFMLAAAVAVSAWATVELCWRKAFNTREQLVIPAMRANR